MTEKEQNTKVPKYAERASEKMDQGATRRTSEDGKDSQGEKHMGAVETEMVTQRPPTVELADLLDTDQNDQEKANQVDPGDVLTNPG